MSRRPSLLSAALLALFAGPALAAPPGWRPQVMAYWESDASTPALEAEASVIRQVATDSWAVDATGALSGRAPADALAFAAAHGMRRFATISNYGATDWDTAAAHAILTEPAAQAQLFAGMAGLVGQDGYDGINIDFEALLPGDRAAFTAFIAAASAQLHARQKWLVVSVPAMQQDNPDDSWSGAYDLAALGPSTDLVQYMTYDENGPWGSPGPVAGLDWVEAAARYAMSAVGPGRISLGVPAYGYDWDLTAGTGNAVPVNQVPALLAATGATPRWDAASSSPYFDYTLDGDQHVVWYEDDQSLALKSGFAESAGLAGLSIFALGDEDAEFWLALERGMPWPHPRPRPRR